MKLCFACIPLVVLASVGCEHPAASARLAGPVPAGDAPRAVAAEAKQALHANRTLQLFLEQQGPLPADMAVPRHPSTAGPTRPLVPASWLETQSATLRTLVDRSRAARLAIDAAQGAP